MQSANHEWRYFEAESLEWVIEGRNMHRPHGSRLDPELRRRIAPYFRARTLDQIRIRKVDTIENPPFLKDLARAGSDRYLDFRFAAGITFVDTIVLSDRIGHHMDMSALIFHEAVHVAQYRCLGPERFMRRYIREWIENGYEYYRISIEDQAYRLQRRFEKNSFPFSVEDIIVRLFGY